MGLYTDMTLNRGGRILIQLLYTLNDIRDSYILSFLQRLVDAFCKRFRHFAYFRRGHLIEVCVSVLVVGIFFISFEAGGSCLSVCMESIQYVHFS